MSKHSQSFENRKAQLQKEEEELKKALELESDEAEKNLKNGLKWIGISVLTVGVIYGISRAFRSKNEDLDLDLDKKEKKNTRTVNKTLLSTLLEKSSDQLIALGTGLIASYISRLQEKQDSKGS